MQANSILLNFDSGESLRDGSIMGHCAPCSIPAMVAWPKNVIREYQQVCIAAYRRGDAFHLGAVSVTGCFDIHGAAYHNRPEIAVSGHLLKFHIINGVRELLVDFFCEVYKGDFRLCDAEFAACGQIIFDDFDTLLQGRIGDYGHI